MLDSHLSETKTWMTIRLLVLLPTVLCLVLGSLDSLWSLSSDMAHHYALVVRIGDGLGPVGDYDLSLGEMNSYPRLSHEVAAVIGKLAGSALIGMHSTSLLAIALFWACIAGIVLSLPPRAGMFAITTLSLLLLLNRRLFSLELDGDEVVGNYFFAQLVGQSFLALTLALGLLAERHDIKPWWRYGFLAGAVYVIERVHLLPAVVLLGFMSAMIALEAYQYHVIRKPGAIRFAVAGTLVIAATLMIAIFNPSFSAMLEISKNNGEFEPHLFDSIGRLAPYCLVVIASAGALLWRSHRMTLAGRGAEFLAIKYVALFALVVAGLCLLQIIALKMGNGSEYAVKKYVYLLNTALFLEISMWAGLIGLRGSSISSRDRPQRRGLFYASLLPSLFTAFAFFNIIPSGKLVATSGVVDLERQLVLRRDLLIPETAGKATYVSAIDGLPAPFPYMLSIALFRAPRLGIATNDLLLDRSLSDWAHIGTVVTSANSYLDAEPKCRRAPPVQGLVMLDGACLASQTLTRPVVIGFTSKDPPMPCTAKGLSGREPHGTWTDGDQVILTCPIPSIDGKAATSLRIDTFAYLENLPFQRAIFMSNGVKLNEYTYDAAHPESLVLLRLPENSGDSFELKITLPDAAAPNRLGSSSDSRRLGIGIRKMEFK
jgi:hypothetical protein